MKTVQAVDEIDPGTGGSCEHGFRCTGGYHNPYNECVKECSAFDTACHNACDGQVNRLVCKSGVCNPPPAGGEGGGDSCNPNSQEANECSNRGDFWNNSACQCETSDPDPVHCQVSTWSNYGECSVTCGGGTQTRTRTVTRSPENGGNGCPVLTESRACNTEACTHTLSITKTGNGTGVVKNTEVTCDASRQSCSKVYNKGTSASRLTTEGGTGVFRGWSNGCTGTGTCGPLVMSQDRIVTALFSKPVLTVDIRPAGAASNVTASNGARTTSTNPWKFNVDRTLIAGPSVTMVNPSSSQSGYRFDKWTGDCTATTLSGCSITMTDNKTAIANFVQRHPLNLSKAGDGTGTVKSTEHREQKFDCGNTCQPTSSAPQTKYFDHPTNVTLTATNTGTGLFRGWSGGVCSGTSATCTVPMIQVRNVTATFNRPVLTFNLTRPGNVRDATTQYPHQDFSGLQRKTSHDLGTDTTIDASKTTVGYKFNGWASGSAPCSGDIAVCSLLMDRDRTVTANYITLEPTATLTYSPTPNIAYNTSPALTWGSTNATNCQGSPTVFQTGNRPNGTWINGPKLTAHTTYQVTCYGPHPTGATAEVLVRVRAPEPIIEEFKVNPVWVRRDGDTTLSWKVLHPGIDGATTSCKIVQKDSQGESTIYQTTMIASGDIWANTGVPIENIQGVTDLTMTCRTTKDNLDPSNEVKRTIQAFVLPIYAEY